MLYRVKRDCIFQRRYWEKGEEVEFPEDVTPPEHFIPLPTVAQKVKAAQEKMDLATEEEPAAMQPVNMDNLEKQTVEQLRKLADECGIEVPAKIKKEELIALIREG